jgi:hypothetical protein
MDAAEQIVFALLKNYRIKNRREFFKCDLEIIIINMKKVESKSEIETITENKIIKIQPVTVNINNIQSNDHNHICPMCFHQFSSLQRLQTHLKKKKPCYNKSPFSDEITQNFHHSKKFFCQYCYKGFTRNDSLIRHQKSNCSHLRLPNHEEGIFIATIKNLEHQIDQLKNKQENIEKQMVKSQILNE